MKPDHDSKEHNQSHCSCETHSHSHDDEKKSNKKISYAIFFTGAALFIAGLISADRVVFQVKLILFIASYILTGGDVILRAVKNILRGKIFDENFLMITATAGAFAIGEYPEGIAVMIFYKIGEALQDYAADNSRKSISDMMDIRPDYANLITEQNNGEIKKVSPEEVNVGDYIIIKPGEKIPLDGIVIKGQSFVDTSSLTGESLPRETVAGSEVLSGSLNQNGLLTVRVTKTFNDSTVSKILELVQNAENKKAKTENFITKFAKY